MTDPIRATPPPHATGGTPHPAASLACGNGTGARHAHPPAIHLIGPGAVGRAFLDLVHRLPARIVAVTDTSGTVHDPDGLDAAAIARHKLHGGRVATLPGATRDDAAALQRVRADLVVDATTTRFDRPGWATLLERDVLGRGAALVLAAKDALCRAADRWLAGRYAARVGSNAVLGGTGARFASEFAELNGRTRAVALAGNTATTQILLCLEAGATLEEGLEEAGRRGFLETEPELDLRGDDAAVKLAIVAGALLGRRIDPTAIPCQDLRTVDFAEVRARAARGATTRLVARLHEDGRLESRYEEIGLDSPLAVPPGRVAYVYHLVGGDVRVHEGDGLGARGTAAALYEDAAALLDRLATTAPERNRLAALPAGRDRTPPEAPAARSTPPDTTHVLVIDDQVPLPSPFPLAHGGRITGGRVAYRLVGPPGTPVVAVLGGISANRRVTGALTGTRSVSGADGAPRSPGEAGHGTGVASPEPGWWDALVGPGRTVDTTRFRVLGIDYLGGAGGSSAPDAPPDAGDAGCVSTADQANALVAVLDALGIDTLHSCIGASYGGMVALALGERHAGRAKRLVVLSAAHGPHPMATALRHLQRAAVRLGAEAGRPADGVSIARGIGITTYRTAAEFADRFESGAEPPVEDGMRFDVERYLEHHARRFAARFPADAYLRLSLSLDLHAVAPERVRSPAWLVAVDSDTLVPVWQVQDLATRLGAPCRLHLIASRCGHDAFLKEPDRIGGLIARALTEPPPAERPAAPRADQHAGDAAGIRPHTPVNTPHTEVSP